MELIAILGDRWVRTERAYSKVPSKSLPFRPRRGRAFTSHSSRNHTGSRRRGSGSPTPYGINMTNVSSGAIDNSRVYNYNDLSIVMTIVSDVVLNNVIAMPSTILVTNSTHVEVSYSTAELIDIEASSDVQVSN